MKPHVHYQPTSSSSSASVGSVEQEMSPGVPRPRGYLGVSHRLTHSGIQPRPVQMATTSRIRSVVISGIQLRLVQMATASRIRGGHPHRTPRTHGMAPSLQAPHVPACSQLELACAQLEVAAAFAAAATPAAVAAVGVAVAVAGAVTHVSGGSELRLIPGLHQFDSRSSKLGER